MLFNYPIFKFKRYFIFSSQTAIFCFPFPQLIVNGLLQKKTTNCIMYFAKKATLIFITFFAKKTVKTSILCLSMPLTYNLKSYKAEKYLNFELFIIELHSSLNTKTISWYWYNISSFPLTGRIENLYNVFFLFLSQKTFYV